MRALLLAAGKGTRLSPLTDIWPKCLMPIQNRPLLEYWLRNMLNNGVSELLVNVHHHSDIVYNFFSRPQLSGVAQLVYEEKLLGTAGTIRHNKSFFGDEPALVIHADNWSLFNFPIFLNAFRDLLANDECSILMMTFKTDNPKSCGVVKLDGEIVIDMQEKAINPQGDTANAAVYGIKPDVIRWICENDEVTDFSTEVLPHFYGKIRSWHNSDVHRDIGTIRSLLAAQTDKIPAHSDWLNDQWQIDFENHHIHSLLGFYGKSEK